jgi:hypothetical protein
MRTPLRSLLVTVGVLAVSGLSLVAGAGAATSARSVKDSGTSYVSIVHQKGKLLYAGGYSFDKKFGQNAITFQVTATNGTTGNVDITAKRVTFYTPTGTLYGTASAVQNLATGSVTAGKLNLTHGTGAQAGHTFKGTFAGTFDTKSAVYTFHYTGTYK